MAKEGKKFLAASKVLVIASGDKIREAIDADADFAGGDELVSKIHIEEGSCHRVLENWLDYDAVGGPAR